jgi:CheY-like chemotaxis protein
MDGIAAIKALREDPLTRNITVFATTAYALPEDVAKIVRPVFHTISLNLSTHAN